MLIKKNTQRVLDNLKHKIHQKQEWSYCAIKKEYFILSNHFDDLKQHISSQLNYIDLITIILENTIYICKLSYSKYNESLTIIRFLDSAFKLFFKVNQHEFTQPVHHLIDIMPRYLNSTLQHLNKFEEVTMPWKMAIPNSTLPEALSECTLIKTQFKGFEKFFEYITKEYEIDDLRFFPMKNNNEDIESFIVGPTHRIHYFQQKLREETILIPTNRSYICSQKFFDTFSYYKKNSIPFQKIVREDDLKVYDHKCILFIETPNDFFSSYLFYPNVHIGYIKYDPHSKTYLLDRLLFSQKGCAIFSLDYDYLIARQFKIRLPTYAELRSIREIIAFKKANFATVKLAEMDNDIETISSELQLKFKKLGI